jgi:hypothetical protein
MSWSAVSPSLWAATSPNEDDAQWQSPSPLSRTDAGKVHRSYFPAEREDFDNALRAGIIVGNFAETGGKKNLQFAAYRRDFAKHPYEAWQAELKVGSSQFLELSAGKKFYFPLEPVTAPYYRFAVGDLVLSPEGIGSVLNIKKFRAIAAVGLDDAFFLAHRLQFEIAIGTAMIGSQAELSLGFAF